MDETRTSGLSSAEAELYDRQIRLWGIESQEKLRAANVLLIGVRALGSEIAKDLLLSGINSLTILDDGVVTAQDVQSNFLLSARSLDKDIAAEVLRKAKKLNPLVKITADTDQLAKKSEEFYKNFTIAIASGLKTKQIVDIDNICRKLKVQFIYGDVFGMFGFSMSDFQDHEYYEDQVKLPPMYKRSFDGRRLPKYDVPIEKALLKTHRTTSYPTLDEVLYKLEKKKRKPRNEGKRGRRNELYYLMRLLLQFRDENDRDPLYSSKDDDLKKLQEIREDIIDKCQINGEKLKVDVLDLVFGVASPICAIVGGVIAQEVIKAVSHKEVPINNVFLLNPYTYAGKEELISP